MERLPPELLREIVDIIAAPDTYESRVDLGTFRLLGRQYAPVAAPLLFHTVPLWISLKNLQSLAVYSNNPDL